MEPDKDPRGQRKVVLVIGADHAVAANVASVLPEWRVQRVGTNSAALELIRLEPYDLVLTGDETPGSEDVELLGQIRTVRPHTRLIIITNQSTPADVIAAMRNRAFSYFSRPYSLENLSQMLQLAANGPVWDDGIEMAAGTTQWIRLFVRCDVRTADRLLQFIHELADLPASEKGTVGVAFREILMNAIEHGARFDPRQHVEIAYLRTKRAITCRVKDPGHGFSLEELRHSAVTNPPDDPLRHVGVRQDQGLRPGGFGILLAKRLVDELIYGESGNDVILIKYLDDQQNEAEQASSPVKDASSQ